MVLVPGRGEKLHRLHVGHGVDDLAGDHRTGRGPAARRAADTAQEAADEQDVEDDPDQERQRHLAGNREGQRHRTQERGEAEGHRLDHAGHHFGRRPRRLHLFLRDPAGEVVVEEGDRLADGEPVQAAEDQREDVRLDQHGRGRGVHPEDRRPDDDVEHHEAGDQQGVLGEDIRPGRAVHRVDDHAEQHGRDRLQRAGYRRPERGPDDPDPGAFQRPEEERHGRVRRVGLGPAEGMDAGDESHSAASPATSPRSSPRKPPDWRAQNRA